MNEQRPFLFGRALCYGLLLLAAYLISTTTAPLEILGYRLDLIGCVHADGGSILRDGFRRFHRACLRYGTERH